MAALGGIGRQVLQTFGIEHIDPEAEYPFQIRRSIHATVLKRFGSEALYSFGFAYGDSWRHIHEALSALRHDLLEVDDKGVSAMSETHAIDKIGDLAFALMHELLEKNSHGDVYYGAWFTHVKGLQYRAEMRNTSSLDQVAFPHGLVVNYLWSYLSDHWEFETTFDREASHHGPEWTHFVWNVTFKPRRSDRSAQELTWAHRTEAREALLAQVLAESELKNRLIMESINYARLLQEAQLPRPNRFAHRLKDWGVLWQPRDTIGGDLWWVTPDDGQNTMTFVVVDCAGHGVPGAMLALLASTTLERIFAGNPDTGPADALMALGNALRRGLNQDQDLVEGDVAHDDGCDAAALQIHTATGQVVFAGANLSALQLPATGPIIRRRGDSMRLGYRDALDARPTEQTFVCQPGDRWVMATDGVVDQVGHQEGQAPRAFGFKRLMQCLEDERALNASALMNKLGQTLQDWQGEGLRRDDVTALCLQLF